MNTETKNRHTHMTQAAGTLTLCALFLSAPLSGMQASTRMLPLILRASRTVVVFGGSYYLYDTVCHDGKRTRAALENTTQKLSELYETGTNKLETLMGKNHNETITLLKKNQRELKKIRQQQERVEQRLGIDPQEKKQQPLLEKLSKMIFPAQEKETEEGKGA